MFINSNGPEVSASSDQLMRQAPMTVDLYMRSAIESIDAAFGEGYAREHPELVASFINSCATDFNTACMGYALQGLRDAVGGISA